MKNFFVLNGPNLDQLGKREPEVYGSATLLEVEDRTKLKLKDFEVSLTWWQSNSESEIIDKIHALTNENFDALVINPAAYSHTSIAILDALKLLTIPIAEVHLTNVYTRESYRHSLLTAQAASIIMSGLGIDSYQYAVKALLGE